VAACPLFSSHMESALKAIDSDWDRTDLGFTIADIVSGNRAQLAPSLVENAHEDRRRSPIPDGRMATSYIL